MSLRLCLVAGGLSLALGCVDVDSEDISTEGMYAEVSVEALGDGTSTAIAVLRVGGPNSFTFVELSQGDVLEATLEGQTVAMEKQTLADFHRYAAAFGSAPVATPYTVVFTRDTGSKSESVVELPPPFTLTSSSTERWSRSSDLTLTWEPDASALPMELYVSGSCVSSLLVDVPDAPGSYTIAADTLALASEEEECEVELSLSREVQGTVSDSFEGGTARGRQVRVISLVSAM